jgi:hypothetical protein
MTDNEIHDCFQQRSKDKVQERRLIADAIEAKLKVRWQGLTDEELMEILGYGKIECSPTRDFDFVDVIDVKLTRSLINAIEAKLKEKNT